ncbi:MAG: pyridoxamine 5'-phosphate oxidase [Gammaproteobacteria bacterium]|nr:MAG: pyridoxamine 5'-phosphate oxidase [Gammaproteobacteria bacterium]
MQEDSAIEARRDYLASELHRDMLVDDPVVQFGRWLSAAQDAKLIDTTAMILATTDNDGGVHARIVLLKQFDASGFCWFTSRHSDKGRQLAAKPRAALLFHWRELERQVRIEGPVSHMPDDEADAYFQSRPEGSRFSAAASAQSQVVDSRKTLEARVAELRASHPDGKVPRPPHWGGYRLAPERFEFWQGRADRLHDRFVYRRSAETDDWIIERLQP